MTLNLSKHHALSLLSLLLGLLYSYYIIYWHEVYVEMAVEAISRMGLDGFNNSVMKTVLGLCGLGIVIITWAIWRQFQFNRRPRTILLGLTCFALLVAVWFITHTVFLLEMNVELIHVPMYIALTFFLFFAFRHWTMVVLVALPIMLYDEWYQYMVLHAHYETYYSFNDVMCDVLGLATGLLLLSVFGFYPKHRKLNLLEWGYVAAVLCCGLYLFWLGKNGFLVGYESERLMHTRFVFNQLLDPEKLWQIHSYTFKEYVVLKPKMGASIVLMTSGLLCLTGLFFRERGR